MEHHLTLLSSVLSLAGSSGAEFLVGRLLPSGFDLPELNGGPRMRPGDAARACEEHPRCAGLTYRGLMPAEGAREEERQSVLVLPS